MGLDARHPGRRARRGCMAVGRADRRGPRRVYSYQWLENLIGCQVRNAGTIHPEWAAREGAELSLHPKAPALRIVSVEPGRALVAYMAPVRGMSADGLPGAPAPACASPGGGSLDGCELAVPRRAGRPGLCRVISRYRCDTSGDLLTRLQFGPAIIEPVGFAMDRRIRRRQLPQHPALLSAGTGRAGQRLPARRPRGRQYLPAVRLYACQRDQVAVTLRSRRRSGGEGGA